MSPITLDDELQRLRAAIADNSPAAEPLHEISSVRQDDAALTRRWFRSTDRELLAGEKDGRWLWLEYTFPAGLQTLVLRWTDGEAPQLWKVDRRARHNTLNPGSEILEILGATPFPAKELEQMERAMQTLPHSLWARVVKLALQLRRLPE